MSFVQTIINHFLNDEFFSFWIFTNGWLLAKYIDYFDEIAKSTSRLWIQVSYDGQPIHSIYRRHKTGCETTDVVRQSILLLAKHNIPFSIKSVLPVQSLDLLLNVYKDIEALNEELRSFNKTVTYNPSLDYTETYDWSFVKPKLKRALSELLVYLLDKKEIYITWFLPLNRRPYCSAGLNICSLSYDGFLYPCHGFIYLKKTPYKFHMNELSIEKLQEMQTRIQMFRKYEPLECRRCNVNTCTRCHAVFYNKSSKSKEEERWFDKDSTYWVCKAYKLIDKAYRVLKYLRG
jgi:radical SAM protein with 4Fe4S-binding SPASM domain